jgi:hypothetical protein
LEFSPTGETIYHHQRFPATSEVAFVGRNLATGKETELFRRKDYGANLTGFRLSPDGQYFATHTIDAASNSRVVLLIPTAGGPPRELLRVPAGVKPEDLSNGKAGTWAFVYSWTDSRSLVLRETFNDPNKNDELWLVSLDGQKIGKIDLPLLNARWGLNVFLSPDYRYAAYVVREPAASPTAEVSILENFLPKPAPGK